MTATPTPRGRPEKLHWIKYNPTEWLGMYPELNDEEYGLFHRIIAKLWSTPGNRLNREALLTELRVPVGSHRAELMAGLIGYALKADDAGGLFVPAIDDAFADVVRRGQAATAGATARWNVPKAATGAPTAKAVNPHDF